MKKLIYTGNTQPGGNPMNLRYRSTGEVENGMVLVVHIMSGDAQYYTEEEYNNLFKAI
jgi:hypothetical protein